MVMVAHKLYERRCICFPIHREAFQILERGVDPHTGEQRNGIFGVLVKVSVEEPLVHEIRFAADVKENPSQIVQLEGCKSRGTFCDRILNFLSILADCLFSARLDLCNDREAIIGRSSWKDWTVAALLKLEVPLLGDRHGCRFCPVRCTGHGWLRALAGCQLCHLEFVGFDWSGLRFSSRRSAECQRRGGCRCAQEVTASGFSDLIVSHEALHNVLISPLTDGSSFCREVVPEIIEALGAAKQSGKDCQVRKHDVPGARSRRWHPEEAIKFGVSGFDKRMRPGQINRLPGKNPNCARIFRCQRIMRQVLVKIEGRYVREPTMPVEVAHGRQRCNLVSTLDNRWTKSKTIFHRHAEAFHKGSGIQAEALLAWDQWIAVMGVLHLKPFHIL